MKKTLFITGATGFIGTHIIKHLKFQDYDHIYCLGRSQTDEIKKSLAFENFTFIKGDIFETKTYSHFLMKADIVIHLCALTGKAIPKDYFHVNHEGTRLLLDLCKNKQFQRFVFISSIAATFDNIKNYYYAQSKLKAEQTVKQSGLSYTILRPTIVIGKNSSILNNFSKLAKAPIVPIFGDGTAMIQPIDVDDLSECILHAASQEEFKNKAIDMGGPEQITIEDFIKEVHHRLYQKNYKPIHMPIRLITHILSVLEKKFLSLLPFTAGQLLSFSNAGIAPDNPFISNQNFKLKTVSEMLSSSILSTLNDQPQNNLEKESIYFTNYLIKSTPDSYVVEMYRQGHSALCIDKKIGFLDSFLIKTALTSLFFTRLADLYTSTFYRHALLRKKILLLIAILECRKSTYDKIDSVEKSSCFSVLSKLFKILCCFIPFLILSIIVYGPAHVIHMIRLKILS